MARTVTVTESSSHSETATDDYFVIYDSQITRTVASSGSVQQVNVIQEIDVNLSLNDGSYSEIQETVSDAHILFVERPIGDLVVSQQMLNSTYTTNTYGTSDAKSLGVSVTDYNREAVTLMGWSNWYDPTTPGNADRDHRTEHWDW